MKVVGEVLVVEGGLQGLEVAGEDGDDVLGTL